MIKKSVLSLFVICASAALPYAAKAQSYKIESLERTGQTISVLDNSRDLTIFSLQDTLHIKSFFNELDTIFVLNKNFLKIVYGLHAGTGLNVHETLILCIYHQMLYEAAHFASVSDEEFIDFRKKHKPGDLVDVKTIYELAVTLAGNTVNDYKLNINIHEARKVKSTPKANYDRQSKVVLNFDTAHHVFHNTSENLSKYFTVFDEKTVKEHKLFMMGTFPKIILGSYTYYYIKNEWYEASAENDLTKYAYR
jgi:ABC-type antimicrobial peptide transport system permease subunit